MRIQNAEIQRQLSVVAAMSKEDRNKLTPEDREALDKRGELIEGMNTALRDVFTQIQTALQSTTSDAIHLYYTIGTLFVQVKSDRSGEIYGKDAYKRLRFSLGYEEAPARKAIILASDYTPEEVQELASISNPVTGTRITKTHLQHVLRNFSDALDESVKLEENKQKRAEYLRRSVMSGWSAKTLGQVIQSEEGASERKGRTHVIPTNKAAALSKVLDYYKEGNKYMDNLWMNVENSLVQLLTGSMEDVNADTITTYDLALEKMRDHYNKLKNLIELLEEADVRDKYIRHLGSESVEPVSTPEEMLPGVALGNAPRPREERKVAIHFEA